MRNASSGDGTSNEEQEDAGLLVAAVGQQVHAPLATSRHNSRTGTERALYCSNFEFASGCVPAQHAHTPTDNISFCLAFN